MGLTRALARHPNATRAIAAAAAAVGIALAAVAVFAAADAGPRLDRALTRMESLAGFHFEMTAAAAASGTAAPGGPIGTRVVVVGDHVTPDRTVMTVEQDGVRRGLLLIERRTWIDAGDGWRQSVRLPVGPLRDPRAPLTFVRGPGVARFAGLGFSGGNLTYRIRLELSAGDLAARLLAEQNVPPEATGAIEIEVGLFDDLIRRQRVEIREPAEALGTGLTAFSTDYTVNYSRFGLRAEIREPE